MEQIELYVDAFEENDLKPRKPKRLGWDIKMSDFARYTHNPIRAIVEGMKIEPNPEKQLIALSIGMYDLLEISFIYINLKRIMIKLDGAYLGLLYTHLKCLC